MLDAAPLNCKLGSSELRVPSSVKSYMATEV
jgi:hypothetical protein